MTSRKKPIPVVVRSGAHSNKHIKKQSTNSKGVTYIIGVDEVGRGPLAGPVTVCAAMMAVNFPITKFVNNYKNNHKIKFTDSKGLNEKERDAWHRALCELALSGDFIYAIKSKTAKQIDTQGIAVCIKKLVAETIADVIHQGGEKAEKDMGQKTSAHMHPNLCHVYLDGGLYAPEEYTHQSTHTKGDVLYPIISFASIMAKVHRDTFMKKIALKHPTYKTYGFDIHKGYGTKKHRLAIRKYGASEMHRLSFCKNILRK